MINVNFFVEQLQDKNIDFYCGVPDSLLKDFCAYIKDTQDVKKNIIAANEGNAIGIASGYYLASGKIPLVYMQNSGLGNIINPVASLQDKLVYSIPSLFLIGWRGEPGVKDEPQHVKQGMITLELLQTLGIKYSVIDKETTDEEICRIINNAYEYMKKEKEPYAIVVKKGSFNEYLLKNSVNSGYEMTREEAIEVLVDNFEKGSVVISTTGMASRELYEIREKKGQSHESDFLTVGSMGHASQIALGISMHNESKTVYCIDGDGSMLMHLGGLAIIGEMSPKNFKHIIINNGAHDSVGGQDTVGFGIDFLKLGCSLGYKRVIECNNKNELLEHIKVFNKNEGPILLEIRVKKGARKDLGRPKTTPIQNKEAFVNYLRREV